MPIINSFLAELDREEKPTMKVLERVPTDQLSWTPHPKSRPIGRLAWHLAAIPKNVQRLLQAGTFDVAQIGAAAPIPESTAVIVEAFQQNSAAARAYLATLTDEFLQEPFTMTRGEQIITTFPKIGVVRNMLFNHTYHHRGQLTVYLRLLDVPLPVVYGPSADEAF